MLSKVVIIILLFFVPSSLLAQDMCNGTLGNPIYNNDFGSGSSKYGPALNNGTGDYSYVTHGPFDGEYTIANGTFDMFNYVGGWHQIPDHGPGDDGYMLIVSAAPNPSDFFKENITGLCPNTQYEIASWIVRLPNYVTLNPNITISIETTAGVLLAPEINTGDINNSILPLWNRFQGMFSTGNETEVVLRMRSNNPGGDGNDFGLDDITIRPCIPIITPSINHQSSAINTCEGTTETFNLSVEVSDGYSNPKYQWQRNSGSGWADITGESTTSLIVKPGNAAKGTYLYRLLAAEGDNINSEKCRITSDSLTVNIYENPVADAGADQTILAEKSTILNGKVTGDSVRYYWTPTDYLDDATKLNPRANPPTDIIYTLHAESNFGCTSSSDEVLIKVNPNIVIPKAFTPNGDAINDTWNIPTAESFLNTIVRITNRYGQLVYQSTGKYKPWDGKFNGTDLPSAAYYYTINFNNGSEIYSGWIMLIR
ncbi:T9SS type B sorting domain-containing protein [Pedobacter mucosus]|uniref:T9SS type B sorting domain-containing protein n=1 Tax=Pedobacter mucosus TaxID=2895286 RepID=UPI001EE4061F|nr:T9SS type B sorting domain-containing protein [Pedobacter mucosus]UKT64844.1 T9SS type B sorting domain-containing protein [Pedobacter mucosus]